MISKIITSAASFVKTKYSSYGAKQIRVGFIKMPLALFTTTSNLSFTTIVLTFYLSNKKETNLE